jgi:hypothetical protein
MVPTAALISTGKYTAKEASEALSGNVRLRDLIAQALSIV